LVGYGATFERYSQNLGGFVEIISKRAFDDVLARNLNVVGLVNHDMNWLLASTDSGTMRLSTDEIGLAYEMTLDESDPDAVRAMAKIRTGKITGSSFSFNLTNGGDEWGLTEQGFPLRRINTFASVFDTGPVVSPAYLSTTEEGLAVALRSLAESRNLNLGTVVDLARKNELRTALEGESPAPAPEVVPDVDESAAQHARASNVDLHAYRQRALQLAARA
jgi:uncharacterized protein